MADVSVRPAEPADAAEIARVQVTTWRTAYARLLPAAVLAGLTSEHAHAAWATAIAEPPGPGHHVLVAVEQRTVVGFVAFGPDPDGPAATAEIATLLVEPRWGRRGHGSRLLAATVDTLRGDGASTARVWLPHGDRASESFYASAGWEPDGGSRTLEGDGGVLRESRLHVALDGSADGGPG